MTKEPSTNDERSSSEILARADQLKARLPGDGHVVANETRLSLLDLYTQLLTNEMELALEKRIEQELWNTIFKQPISELQSQIRDKKNPRRTEAQVTLGLLLDQSTGFYVGLLGNLCESFGVSLPCRRRLVNSLVESVRRPLAPVVLAPRNHLSGSDANAAVGGRLPPGRASVLSMCQHCLVHLGDVARYYQQTDQAAQYYSWAVKVDPVAGGHPYNQLAILEATKNRLSSVYFYVRAIACPNPFPAASTNLDKMLERLAKEPMPIMPVVGKVTEPMTSAKLALSTAYLEFFALIYLQNNMTQDGAKKAKSLWDRFSACLPPFIEGFSDRELVQIASLHTFLLHSHLQKKASARQHKPAPGTTKESTWTRLILYSTVDLVGCLCKAVLKHEEGTPQEQASTSDGLFSALLILLIWYRASVKALSTKNKDSSGCASPPFPDVVSQCLNVLQERSTTAPPQLMVTLETLITLPELEILQGFLPLSLPTTRKAKWETKQPECRSSSATFSLRLACLLWCARDLASSLPGLLTCHPTPDSEPNDSTPSVTFVAVRPSSPPLPSGLVGSSFGPVAPRIQTKRNVAIESIMQNQQHQPSGPVQVSSHTSITIPTNHHQQPPPPLIPQHQVHQQQPGLIFHDNIARFIQEQSAQVSNSSVVGGYDKTAPTNLVSSASSPALLANSGDQLSGEAVRGSRHLYNENREQFQRDLPPRFARMNHSSSTHSPTPVQQQQTLQQQQPDLTGKETENDCPVSSSSYFPPHQQQPVFALRDYPPQPRSHDRPILQAEGGHPPMNPHPGWAWPLDRFSQSGMQPQPPSRFLYEPPPSSSSSSSSLQIGAGASAIVKTTVPSLLDIPSINPSTTSS